MCSACVTFYDYCNDYCKLYLLASHKQYEVSQAQSTYAVSFWHDKFARNDLNKILSLPELNLFLNLVARRGGKTRLTIDL